MNHAQPVILSVAKNLLVAKRLKQKQILRFAQDDSGMDVSSKYLWDTALEELFEAVNSGAMDKVF